MVSTLTPILTGLTVEAHGGQFTERELPLLLGKTPCILIAATGVSRYVPYAPGQWQGDTGWAAYCLGADSGGNRAEQAMDAAQALLDQMLDQTWGLADSVCEPPDFTTVRAENLYSGHVNILRVALWVVTWQQTLTFATTETFP
jgi:hypothetical protein